MLCNDAVQQAYGPRLEKARPELDYRRLIRLDYASERPLYQQIVDQVLDRQKSGAFPPGFRLPPTRLLSQQLDIHRNTVVRAFEELQAMGVISSTVGRGSFVTAQAPDVPMSRHSTQGTALPWSTILSKRLDAPALARFDRLSRSQVGSDTINLQRMQPSPDLLPVEPLRRCLEHVLRTTEARALGYAPRDGAEPLREQIAEMLGREGVPTRPEDVVITSGAQQALDLVARALIDPGDPVMIEALSYSGAINMFAAHGATLVPVATDAEGPDLAHLARAGSRGAKLFYVIPNGHNPTSSTMSAARREDLVAWSRRAGVPLLEDDFGADLDLDGDVMPLPLRALDADVIHVGTFSKRLIPALRVGYVVCPAPLRPALLTVKHAADLGGSLLLQLTLAEFLERGYLRGHLRRVIPEYRSRRDALEEALTKHVPAGVTWAHVGRGVSLWLRLPAGVDAEQVFRAAEKRGVLVSPGDLSGVGSAPVGGIRLTFCAEPPERLRVGAERLGQALEEVLATKAVESASVAAVGLF